MSDEDKITFGYIEEIPQSISEEFTFMGKELTILLYKWRFYKFLSQADNLSVSDIVGRFEFAHIRDSLKNDVLIGIGRFGDPEQDKRNKKMLSIRYVVKIFFEDIDYRNKNFSQEKKQIIYEIKNLKSNFTTLYKSKFKNTRDVHLSHNDLVVHTGKEHFEFLTTPSFLDYPEFTDDDVDNILEYCSKILHNICYFYTGNNLDFATTIYQIGKDLFYWLNFAVEKQREEDENLKT